LCDGARWRIIGDFLEKEEKEETTGQKYNVRICYTQGGHNNCAESNVAYS